MKNNDLRNEKRINGPSGKSYRISDIIKAMSNTDTINIDDIKISSFAAPTEEDRKILDTLPLEVKRALFLREIEKGINGPFSKADIDDIINEAKADIKSRHNG